MSDDKPSSPAVRIIRRRLSFDSGAASAPHAVCPRQLKLISVERCARCPHFAGLVIQPAADEHLRCAFETGSIDDAVSGTDCASDVMTPIHAVASLDSERVGDIAPTPTFSVGADAPVGYVAAIMVQENAEHVLVLNDDQVLIGTLSLRDIARWLAGRAGYLVSSKEPSL